jgi:hypothetical protein
MKLPTNFQPTIVTDFNTFLSYCEAIKPPISKGKEFITRKAVFEINEKLTNPHEGLTVKNDQNHYAQVHLFYHLGLNGDLFFLDWSKKSKPCFTPNMEQIKRFKSLNTTEQYVFLFQSFYVYSDLELIGQDERGHYLEPDAINEELQNLSQVEANKFYGISNRSIDVEKLDLGFGGFTNNSSLLLYGQYFGLWEVTKFDRKNDYSTKTFFFPDKISLTVFGKRLLTFISKNVSFTLWNQPYRQLHGDKFPLGIPIDEKIYEYYETGKNTQPLIEKMDNQYQPFFTTMKPFFGEAIQADFEVKLPKVTKKGNFTLEVVMKYIKPKVSRTIKMGNHLTLEDLHRAIISSVGFDNDHLYAFYMDKNRRNGYGRMTEYNEPPFAHDFTLVDLNLSINKRFNYTFDFGDNWQFIISVKEFEETEIVFNETKLIAKKGESPEQYPSWEEEEY